MADFDATAEAQAIRASVFEASYHAEIKQWPIAKLALEMERQVAAASAARSPLSVRWPRPVSVAWVGIAGKTSSTSLTTASTAGSRARKSNDQA